MLVILSILWQWIEDMHATIWLTEKLGIENHLTLLQLLMFAGGFLWLTFVLRWPTRPAGVTENDAPVTGASSDPPAQLASGMKTFGIAFPYLPANLLDNQWVRAYPKDTEVKPKATVALDSPVSGSIIVEAPEGHAYEYRLPPNVRLSNRVVYSAKYTPTTMIFTQVELSSTDGTQKMNKWIKYEPRNGPPYPTKGYEDYECTFPIPGEPLQDGWRKFELALPEIVAETWGKHGLIFRGIGIFRIRGSLGISPIEFYESR